MSVESPRSVERPDSTPARPSPSRRAALLVAHPGHELRVHHWIEQARPTVLVLTRGDGHSRESRLASTTRVLERAGAEVGIVYGRWRDADVYDALVNGETSVFSEALEEIVKVLVGAGVEVLAADAEERYNPSHDLCRYLAAAAARRVQQATGRTVLDLEFPLIGAPSSRYARDDANAVVVQLDDAALERKLEAASHYPELAAEVEHALATFGRKAFGAEYLTTARTSPLESDQAPYYETYGAAQVAAGHYANLITYDGHVRPMRVALDAAT